MKTKNVVCSSCDILCMVKAQVPESGEVGDIRVTPQDPRKFHADLCMKGVHSPTAFANSGRVLNPLRRVGERGSGQWEEVSWDAALDDIAVRLQKVVDQFGPEALATSMSPALMQNDSGMARRFMNLLGSPNYLSGVSVCMGNTSAVNRLTYGWFPMADIDNTDCIVLVGHDPKPHSWTLVYNAIRRAEERGAKLIVVDPRKSTSAERAHCWVPLEPGTDCALFLGWMKVILDEELYDKEFVEKWTHGFEQFRDRINEYSLERLSSITGIAPALVAESARMYANAKSAVIAWTPITDMQRNSTSAIRLHAALRALCGNLDIAGGESLMGLNPDIISESELELHGSLSQKQRDLTLGADKHPIFTHKAMEYVREPTKKVWGHEWVNFLSGNYMAHFRAVFQAMATGDPYPVKAFFMLANNTLMSYPNMQLVHDGLMNQDLIVAFEQFRTPSAQLADYILPGDSWLERPAMIDLYGWLNVYKLGQQTVQPPGDCRGGYEIWKGLADRMGMGEHFPWNSINELFDHRVAKLGKSYSELAEQTMYHAAPTEYKKYEKTGFATPTGKVELYSTVLEDLGFDPLPYWRPDPVVPAAYNLKMFVGVRENEYFQTGGRHIDKFRGRNAEPRFFVAPSDAIKAGLTDDTWAELETTHGKMKAKVEIQDEMPEGVVRVPHGWWQPERPEGDGSLSGAWEYADAQVTGDDDENLDREQGVPQFKGLACKLSQLFDDEGNPLVHEFEYREPTIASRQ